MNKLASLSLLACCVLAGCASERVILLPSADGKPSAVVVRNGKDELLLNQPYASVARSALGSSPYMATAERVEADYGAVLAGKPAAPRSFNLYFDSGANTLTAESLADLDKVKAELNSRPAPEVMVIGHSDRVGSLQLNDALSLKRAEAVRDLLGAAGVATEKFEIAGRGEREPLVVTEDEVAEPLNRRVEISIR